MSGDVLPIQRRLRRDGIVEFEGCKLRHIGEWRDLEPGDTYAAERNVGPQLLTVRKVLEALGPNNEYAGAVFPVESAYVYDLHECVKVEIIFD